MLNDRWSIISFVIPENAEIHVIKIHIIKVKTSLNSLLYKENKSRLGDPLKTRSNLEHGSFLPPV